MRVGIFYRIVEDLGARVLNLGFRVSETLPSPKAKDLEELGGGFRAFLCNLRGAENLSDIRVSVGSQCRAKAILRLHGQSVPGLLWELRVQGFELLNQSLNPFNRNPGNPNRWRLPCTHRLGA